MMRIFRSRSKLFFLMTFFFVMGCGTPPKAFDPGVEGPQLIVEPDSIRTGVARTMGTEIEFRGKGFEPGDSVFVQMEGVKKDNQEVAVPLADANVDEDGYFAAKVSNLVKVSEILRAKLGYNEENERIIIVSQPPMPEGTYVVRAVSMESDKTAQTRFEVKDASILDRMKDWLGGLLGKIKKE